MATNRRTKKPAPNVAKMAAARAATNVSVEKVNTNKLSKQPRMIDKRDNARGFWAQTYESVSHPFMEVPDTNGLDTKLRDAWMGWFVYQEPHLAGVVSSATQINRNRGWSMTGGRNQVYRFTPVLYNAEGGEGWRPYMDKQSFAYYTSKVGAVTEIATWGEEDPAMAAIFNVDPTAVKLTGSATEPLEYTPYQQLANGTIRSNTSAARRWLPDDYFRIVSMSSPYERLDGLGYPAVERCLMLAQLMCAVYQHDKETLGAAPPHGYLTLNGLSLAQWKQANKARAEDRKNEGHSLYRDIVVLASPSTPIDLKLTTLSQLPKDFSLLTWVQMLMQGYALCFGYDPNEFYSIRSGAALGIAQQSMIQSQKATAKGEMDFVLAWQDQFRRYLPKTVHFEWDERSDEGDRVEAETAKVQAQIATMLYTAENKEEGPLLTKEQALTWLAMRGMIPREWAGDTNDELSDVGEARRAAMDMAEVWRAADEMPEDPIVRMDDNGREMVLWNSGSDFVARRRKVFALTS